MKLHVLGLLVAVSAQSACWSRSKDDTLTAPNSAPTAPKPTKPTINPPAPKKEPESPKTPQSQPKSSIVTTKATWWDHKTDAGGCQLPTAQYVVKDAIALGDYPELQSLQWRQGLCGQVLTIDCGNGPVDAVVASTCNLRQMNCGLDMITPTWNKATGNKPFGITTCKASLSSKNPISGVGAVCYYRPNFDNGNKWFKILGVFNTDGRVSSSATLDGVRGKRNDDGYFEFQAGSGGFNANSKVVYSFEFGSPVSMKLSDCRTGGRTQIFS